MLNHLFKDPKELFEEIMKNFTAKDGSLKSPIILLLEELLNSIMERERAHYLEKYPEDRANGFYPRSLGISFGKLDLKVPRVRLGKDFRPSLLPPKWKRVTQDYEEMLVAFLTNGYREEDIKRTLASLKIPFSKEALKNVLGLIQEKLHVFLSQPLPSDWLAIFIDAFHTQMRTEQGTIKKIVLFTAVGIDLQGYKHILGYWVYEGSENTRFWTEVLKNLMARGVSRVLIFITDDFPGLRGVLRKLFPEAHHQLCFTHFRRNLRNELSRDLYRKVKEKMEKVKVAEDAEEGKALVEEIARLVEKEKPKMAKQIREKAENYTSFLHYPREIRKHIYTTNPVEGLNRGLEVMRLELGGYFPSRQCLEANLFVQAVNLTDRWQRRALPTVKAVRAELKRLLILRYEMEEV